MCWRKLHCCCGVGSRPPPPGTAESHVLHWVVDLHKMNFPGRTDCCSREMLRRLMLCLTSIGILCTLPETAVRKGDLPNIDQTIKRSHDTTDAVNEHGANSDLTTGLTWEWGPNNRSSRNEQDFLSRVHKRWCTRLEEHTSSRVIARWLTK